MDIYNEALQKLAKWRSVFAGWQLGTRADSDPECQAVRDREITLLMRAEVNAQTQLLVKKGVFTQDEFARQLAEEAEILNAHFEQRFPGFTATSYVMVQQVLQAQQEHLGMKIDAVIAAKTMKGWRP